MYSNISKKTFKQIRNISLITCIVSAAMLVNYIFSDSTHALLRIQKYAMYVTFSFFLYVIFSRLVNKYSKTTDYEQEDKSKQENFISASNEGELPTIDDLAASLRMNPSRFEDILHLPKYVRKIFSILLLLVFVIFVLMVVVLYMSTH